MMFGNLGRSFQPGADENGNGDANEPPIQTAIKLLSLRLPQFSGAPSAIAHPSLLFAQGGQGMPPGNSMDALMRYLRPGAMGGGMSQGGTTPQMPRAANVPAPRVIPGKEAPAPYTSPLGGYRPTDAARDSVGARGKYTY